MRTRSALSLFGYFAVATSANAVEVSFEGYLDARLVLPVHEKTWLDGGLGKFRFGSRQPTPDLRLTEAMGQVTLSVTPELRAIMLARAEPEQRSLVDVLESYIAWRPEAQGPLRVSAKGGAFFPPISVENDDLGWTSPYTLTPSAINNWVGAELRTLGAESSVEWRSSAGSITATGAIFCCNEPAGILLAKHGWTLDDRPTGLFERVRLPLAERYFSTDSYQSRTSLVGNVDGHLGWYGGSTWNFPDLGGLGVLYYDNRADLDAGTLRENSWRTQFWSLSYRGRLLGTTLLAQAMRGSTAVEEYRTRFGSAFLLASYDIADWRLSARAEAFATRNPDVMHENEDGTAATVAALWSATDRLRFSAEWIALSSRRLERSIRGGRAERVENQLQLDARFFF